MCAQSLSHVRIFLTAWTVACQAPLTMEFSRQENLGELPFLFPGTLPDPGIEPASQLTKLTTTEKKKENKTRCTE